MYLKHVYYFFTVMEFLNNRCLWLYNQLFQINIHWLSRKYTNFDLLYKKLHDDTNGVMAFLKNKILTLHLLIIHELKMQNEYKHLFLEISNC